MKKYSYAVLVGRFQPFHIGHEALFSHALKIADHVIIVIGSHHAPRSIRNPWKSDYRENLIKKALSNYTSNDYSITKVADSAYNFNDWIMRVQQHVYAIADDNKIAVVGHFKDDTSYYLNYFPEWDLESLPSQARGLSSTKIRYAYYEGDFETIRPLVHPLVYEEILAWVKTSGYKELTEEYNYIEGYKKKWENAPYPPTLVTADAVVFALGHVLLIKRKVNPGKGRYAIPGGFVKTTEVIENACIRELNEETHLDVGYKQLKGSIKVNHVFDHPMRDPRGRVITHAFMFELNVKSLPKIKGGDDAAEALWFPLYKIEAAEELFFNDHAQIIKFFINRMQ